jgi:hypothetical protein
MNLGDNFIQEGLVNRITPFTTKAEGAKRFDTKKTYDIVMNKFKFGGISKKGIYLDETVTRMCYTHRRLMAQLALELAKEGENGKALKVLQKTEKEIPAYNVPLNYMSGVADMAQAYAMIGKTKDAIRLLDALWNNSVQYANYYLSLDGRGFGLSQQDCFMHFHIMMALLQAGEEIDPSWSSRHESQLSALLQNYEAKGGTMPE